VIAGFDSLFGTAQGRVLQSWCERWGWPLLWTGQRGGWGLGRELGVSILESVQID
jgi:hypothetical protein